MTEILLIHPREREDIGRHAASDLGWIASYLGSKRIVLTKILR
jgi:hypothetical protein